MWWCVDVAPICGMIVSTADAATWQSGVCAVGGARALCTRSTRELVGVLHVRGIVIKLKSETLPVGKHQRAQ